MTSVTGAEYYPPTGSGEVMTHEQITEAITVAYEGFIAARNQLAEVVRNCSDQLDAETRYYRLLDGMDLVVPPLDAIESLRTTKELVIRAFTGLQGNDVYAHRVINRSTSPDTVGDL